MISIKPQQSAEAPRKANVLPCRIKYTGPAASSRLYWNPLTETESKDGKDTGAEQKHTSYFRGRKLIGTKVDVPEGYTGYVLEAPSTGDPPSTHQKREMLYQDEEEDDLAVLESTEWTAKASFSEVMVWGHEIAVDSTQDGIIKGVDEWIGMAGALNGYTKP